MNVTIVLNQNDEIAFLHDRPLDFKPEWAAIDIELAEIQIFDSEGEQQSLKLDQLKKEIYEKVCKEEKILLVEIENNDATKPISTITVHLMVSTQIK